MDNILLWMFKKRRLVIGLFLAVTVICALLSAIVHVNTDLMDYLPDDTPSSRAADIMSAEFDTDLANTRIMVENISVTQAKEYAARIGALEGVISVTWLGDNADLNVPLAMQDQDTIANWYADGTALFSATMSMNKLGETFSELDALLPESGVSMSGNSVNSYAVRRDLASEVAMMMAILIPLVLVILLITTNSWAEPFLFLLTCGVAIVINMGTNIIFGSVSFVTQSAAAILQLAVSMDYSIFLLHSFSAHRKSGKDVEDAMLAAIKDSASSVVASGITTVVGFAALMFMEFGIGSDMGRVMAKAIACSLLCSLVLLPLLCICCHRLVERTGHRPFIPPLKKLSRGVLKARIPAMIMFVIIIVPCFLASQANSFAYGGDMMYSGESSETGRQQEAIDERFGSSNTMVIMVPRGSVSLEAKLCSTLETHPRVTSLLSYTNTVGAEIPIEFVPESVASLLLSENYSRMVLTAAVPSEGDEAFAFVEWLRATIDSFYPGQGLLAGGTPSVYDMKDVITTDNTRVNAIAISSIVVVLLLTFRSLLLPLLLVLVIEGSIWINLSFPYFAGDSIAYMAYLIISAMQLGATVDYAILMANRYLDNRRLLPKREALLETVSTATVSVLTSAVIFTVCGTILGIMSSNGIISQLGYLVGRAGLLSCAMVVFVLPALMYTLDSAIIKTLSKKRRVGFVTGAREGGTHG